jgi:hypothetical protein
MIKLTPEQRESRRLASRKFYYGHRDAVLANRRADRAAKRPSYLKNKIAKLKEELKSFSTKT